MDRIYKQIWHMFFWCPSVTLSLCFDFSCVKNVTFLLTMLKEHSDITVGAYITEDSESLEVRD